MSYFKENPAALLDAIPTPRDEGDLDLFRSTGMTPKKKPPPMDLRLNLNDSAMERNRRNSSSRTSILTPT